jgi:hypothetical protein
VRYTPGGQIAKNGGYHIAGKKFAQLGLAMACEKVP